jgi:hypothetical protein
MIRQFGTERTKANNWEFSEKYDGPVFFQPCPPLPGHYERRPVIRVSRILRFADLQGDGLVSGTLPIGNFDLNENMEFASPPFSVPSLALSALQVSGFVEVASTEKA